MTNRRSPDLVRELDRLDAIVFELLVTQPWVPSLNNITEKEIKEQLSRLFVDTAAAMLPALGSGRKKYVVYGSDCDVPCSTEATMEENRKTS